MDEKDISLLVQLIEEVGDYLSLLETSDDYFGRDIEKIRDVYDKAVERLK